jgi:hypothetical protein
VTPGAPSADADADSDATATPGPWTVESDPACLNALVYGKGRKRGQRKQLVAQVWSGDDCSLEVALKNAQIISAAPDMAKALELALEGLRAALGGAAQVDINRHPAIVAGVAALKKADTA